MRTKTLVLSALPEPASFPVLDISDASAWLVTPTLLACGDGTLTNELELNIVLSNGEVKKVSLVEPIIISGARISASILRKIPWLKRVSITLREAK